MAKVESAEQWAKRTKRVLRFIADLQPTEIAPLAAIVDAKDMAAVVALRDSGFIMRCTDTNRYFVPKYAI